MRVGTGCGWIPAAAGAGGAGEDDSFDADGGAGGRLMVSRIGERKPPDLDKRIKVLESSPVLFRSDVC